MIMIPGRLPITLMYSITLLLGLCLSAASLAQTRIVDTIDTRVSGDQAAIRIEFNYPMQYLNHVPLTASDEIQIQLRSVSGVDLTDPETESQQVLSLRPTDTIPLLDVQFETNTTNQATLLLRFTQPVLVQMRSSADSRSLLVELQPNPDQPPASTPQLMAVPGEPFPQASGPIEPEGRYVINLASSVSAISKPLFPAEIQRGHALYLARISVDNRNWNRLRLGFYRTKAAALSVIETLRDQYPDAWVDIASDQEIERAIAEDSGIVPLSDVRTGTTAPAAITPTRPKTSNDKLEKLMEEARQLMTAGEYGRAVQLYTKVLQYPDHDYLQDAQEFLGLARERMGQLAHAKAEYERYLQLYPEGEGASRVRQRLFGLTTARATPREKLRATTREQEQVPWEVYGGFSQYYRRDVSVIDAAGSSVDQSSLISDLDVTSRRRGEKYDLQTRFTGSYLLDFLDDSDDESRVSSLYFDATARGKGFSTRIGRQTRNTGGVLGRFDGALLSYPALSWLRLNAVTGLPVASTQDGLDGHRFFYGLSADLGTFANAWDFVAFYVEQRNDDLIDRRAIGGEARYFDPTHSLLTYLDYDIHYDELNTLLMLGTWTLPSRTTVNMSLDIRKNPILMTGNALQGQPLTTLDELEALFTAEQIEQLAQDRTADSKSLTIGFAHPLTAQYQISADVAVTNLSSTIASGGVDAVPGTGNEYFFGTQLIGSSLFKPGDISILGVRYSDTSTSNTISLLANTRYPITHDWRVNPRIRVDYRENLNDDSTQWTTAPSLRMDYRWRKRYRFEIEAGGEWSTRQLTTDTERDQAYFLSMGYRADF